MPKKQAKNAFWYFMAEWKVMQESQGREFPNGFRDVQADPECNAAWRALSDQEKLPYQNRAKQNKSYEKGKQTGTGESIQKIKEEHQRELEYKLNMEDHIRYTVFDAKKYNALSSKKFLFLHMNWYYMREPDMGPVDFCPAEFAIAEFSLDDGVSDYYHEIIKTNLHLGYAREAIETSEKTHQLHWNLACGEGDWRRIYDKFMSFIAPRMTNNEIPPIYTRKNIAHIIPSLLRRITAGTDKKPDDFFIYTIENLFANMLRAVTEFPDSNVPAVLAETQFSKEIYAYSPNIECDYHKTRDGSSPYCSLSVVRQWGFTFCENCNHHLRIDKIPGIHFPETANVAMNTKPSMSAYSGSMASLISDRSPSVLSATGVSGAHRIRVSERSRDEVKRLRDVPGKLEIIDHSLLADDELPPKPKPEPQYVAVASVPPTKPLRAPTTASQVLMGRPREAPLFNCTNFPVIGGRGMPMKTEEPIQTTQAWFYHREYIETDSD